MPRGRAANLYLLAAGPQAATGRVLARLRGRLQGGAAEPWGGGRLRRQVLGILEAILGNTWRLHLKSSFTSSPASPQVQAMLVHNLERSRHGLSCATPAGPTPSTCAGRRNARPRRRQDAGRHGLRVPRGRPGSAGRPRRRRRQEGPTAAACQEARQVAASAQVQGQAGPVAAPGRCLAAPARQEAGTAAAQNRRRQRRRAQPRAPGVQDHDPHRFRLRGGREPARALNGMPRLPMRRAEPISKEGGACMKGVRGRGG